MRRITSIILAVAFIIVSVSGLEMSLMPKPKNVQQQIVANSEGNKPVATTGMPFYPKKAHEWIGYLFIGAGLVHVVLNKKAMLSYLKPKKERTSKTDSNKMYNSKMG